MTSRALKFTALFGVLFLFHPALSYAKTVNTVKWQNCSNGDVSTLPGATGGSPGTINKIPDNFACACVSHCGDGILDNGTAGICNEQCDSPDRTVCNADCTNCVATCGNRNIECREECDDGNTTDGDGCSSTCHIACGSCDATCPGGAGVACGTHTGQDQCHNSCTIDCGNCTSPNVCAPSTDGSCAPPPACVCTAWSDQGCGPVNSCSNGWMRQTRTCTNSCDIQSQCVDRTTNGCPFCGDGQRDAGEDCHNCPSDVPGACCGDGVCSVSEHAGSPGVCPQDCCVPDGGYDQGPGGDRCCAGFQVCDTGPNTGQCYGSCTPGGCTKTSILNCCNDSNSPGNPCP